MFTWQRVVFSVCMVGGVVQWLGVSTIGCSSACNEGQKCWHLTINGTHITIPSHWNQCCIFKPQVFLQLQNNFDSRVVGFIACEQGPIMASKVSWENRPFYRYSGYVELISFMEYYGMPMGRSLSIYKRFSGKKRMSLYISHYNLFLG